MWWYIGCEIMMMERRSFDTATFPRLRGEEAINALRDFVYELEEQKGKELTEKQAQALIKVTRGLIYSIKTEMQSNQIMNELCEQIHKEARIANNLRKTITKYVQEPICQALRFA